MDERAKNLVYRALLTALCTVATMSIPIPTPTGGYLNAGDIIVVLAALLAGPYSGAIISGFGSALADLFLGYTIYAPGTFVAKAAAAFLIGRVFAAAKKKRIHTAAAAAVSGELLMVVIYFVYASLALGFGLGAAADLPGDLMQGAVGVVGGVLLYHALIRIPQVRAFSQEAYKKHKK